MNTLPCQGRTRESRERAGRGWSKGEMEQDGREIEREREREREKEREREYTRVGRRSVAAQD